MEERLIELSKYRFNTSCESLEDARIMFENGRYKNSLNRAYYCIFHAIRAVNTLKEFDSSKHNGVISFFNRNFGKLSKGDGEKGSFKRTFFPVPLAQLTKVSVEKRNNSIVLAAIKFF